MDVWQPWGGELASELGFVAMVLSWLSLWRLAQNDIRGWWAAMVADGFWMAACLDSGVLSFFVNDVICTVLHLYALRKWRLNGHS